MFITIFEKIKEDENIYQTDPKKAATVSVTFKISENLGIS